VISAAIGGALWIATWTCIGDFSRDRIDAISNSASH
jgi:hypothetical protein